MHHIFKQGNDPKKPVLLLLHGTGGDENSLLSLASIIDDDAPVLSVKGNINENGMPRFFKRLAEGIFDEEDLVLRTHELNQFLDDAAKQYSFDRHNIIAIGYSNGANIAASLMFHIKDALKAAILHHPMVPRRHISLPDLEGVPIFIGAGENDPICTREESLELEHLLSEAGAEVTVHWEQFGHQLTRSEVEAAKNWYLTKF